MTRPSAGAGLSEFQVIAPGRVNLIGDHIDYLGCDVLPVALQRNVTLSVRRRSDDVVRVRSTLHDEEASFRATRSIPPAMDGHWSNYVRAAVQELCDGRVTAGFDATISSDLPTAAGLSSSSALVVASGLAFLAVNGSSVDALELAERMARAERYVGTEGGGMDQAVCLLAKVRTAVRISFSPLEVRHITIPAGWRFIVADSLQHAEKSGAARDTYNSRSRVARDALRTVHDALSQRDVSEMDEAELLERGHHVLEHTPFRRFRHVVTEAGRVDRAARALSDDDPIAFGRCMNESHDSLRDDYEVSTPTLDRMCAILRVAGAFGARLTGAGLGGSVVALCSLDRADNLLDALDRLHYGPADTEPTEWRRFIVQPSGGARIVSAETHARKEPE